MTEKKQETVSQGAVEIDEVELKKAAGGAGGDGRTYTGGRFQIDIGGHNVGYLQPPPPPSVKKT